MPTRINISLTDKECIEELTELRKQLETATDKRLSLADVVKLLILKRLALRDLTLAI